MGLTDGQAPCKCIHGQLGIQGPPGPKVKVKTCGSLGKQHRMNCHVSFTCRVTQAFPENLETQEDKETG